MLVSSVIVDCQLHLASLYVGVRLLSRPVRHVDAPDAAGCLPLPRCFSRRPDLPQLLGAVAVGITTGLSGSSVKIDKADGVRADVVIVVATPTSTGSVPYGDGASRAEAPNNHGWQLHRQMS